MTVWQLHMLNARGALTPILAEIRAHAREVVALVSAHLDLPRFDLVVRAGGPGRRDGVIPDWGIAGHSPAPGIVELTLDPARVAPEHFRRTLVHELHHLARWEGPGYGRSLGEALVSEGLAGHFVLQVLGGTPDPWDLVRPTAGALRQAATLWARHDHDVGEWFLGRGGMRKWTGYGLGHRLVAAHLAQSGGDAASLVHAPAEPFRAALRRLIAEEGAPAPAPENDPTPDDDSAPGGRLARDDAPPPNRDSAPGGHPAADDQQASSDGPARGDGPAPEDDPAPDEDSDPARNDESISGNESPPDALKENRADADRPEAPPPTPFDVAPSDRDAHAAAFSAATPAETDAPLAVSRDVAPPDREAPAVASSDATPAERDAPAAVPFPRGPSR